ncbi:hypothetical protein NT6N_23770 [Oceaniferula spumae]|uniref:Uncharacterized protein n=1 Tax=Oceaniferula spumae TaxID=2979115 RepID=A0AAT9FN47_9BACT
MVYGLVGIVVGLIIIFIVFVCHEYTRKYDALGFQGFMEHLSKSTLLLQVIRSPLVYYFSFAAGGIFGVVHYVYVRRRKTISNNLSEQVEASDR